MHIGEGVDDAWLGRGLLLGAGAELTGARRGHAPDHGVVSRHQPSLGGIKGGEIRDNRDTVKIVANPTWNVIENKEVMK